MQVGKYGPCVSHSAAYHLQVEVWEHAISPRVNQDM